MTDVSIRGLQEAQQANARMIANLRPSGVFGRAIRDVVAERQRYQMSITHVDTGALRASSRMKMEGLKGIVFLDPNAINPRSGARTSVYGMIEDARGGTHAFGKRTATEGMPTIIQIALSNIARGLQ